MFFDEIEKVEQLAEKSGFSIFVMPEIPDSICKTNDENHYIVTPEKDQINIEKIRDVIGKCQVRREKPFFIYVFKAETMNEKAENAFLKLLEEPARNYHFALFTNSPSSLLPTILSRGDLYIQRIVNPLDQAVQTSETIKKYAKRIITARNRDLPSLVSEITSDKEGKKNPRSFALSICEVAIEISYKSFFATGNTTFLKKLPKLIATYDNLKQNGHIKLHLVADLC